jgi:hypothetical protein
VQVNPELNFSGEQQATAIQVVVVVVPFRVVVQVAVLVVLAVVVAILVVIWEVLEARLEIPSLRTETL